MTQINPQMAQMNADKRDEQTYAMIGAAMEVHRVLGHGLLEAVYEALAAELKRRAIPFTREAPIAVFYKGERLNTAYRADFVCFNAVLVELKALSALTGVDEAQVIHYLKATSLKKGSTAELRRSKVEVQTLDI